MEGPGVALPKDKVLDKLGDKYIELRDKKAKLAEEITALDKKAVDRMTEMGITRYRFGDQEMIVKPGATHIKVRSVQVGNENGEGEEDL
jgi:hypothetical protein